MAELLVKATNNIHIDPIKDAMGCYKRGDIVEVRPNNANYGIKEGLPNFVVIKIPNLNYELAKKYMTQQVRGDVIGELYDPEIITKKRKYRLRVDDIPTKYINELKNTGETTVTWEQARNYIRNKATGIDEI